VAGQSGARTVVCQSGANRIAIRQRDHALRPPGRLWRTLTVTVIVALGVQDVLAEPAPPPKRPLREVWLDRVSSECQAWRVSEQSEDKLTRRPLGWPTREMCRELAERWTPDRSKLPEKGVTHKHFFVPMCREAAESLAGRPVDVFWCTRWVPASSAEPPTGPPDDFYAVLDQSPMEAILYLPPALRGATVMPSRRDPLLEKLLLRWTPGKADRAQVAALLKSIGMDCPPSAPGPESMDCTAQWRDFAGTGSYLTRWFRTRMTVAVTFGDRGGWQRFQVTTKETHW
jgi:hypothetical protein